jgi:hypothetical protein
MQPKKPILLYCADEDVLSATTFALRLHPYHVTAVVDSNEAVLLAGDRDQGFRLRHPRSFRPRRLRRQVDPPHPGARLASASASGGSCGRPRPCPLRRYSSVWPQHQNGSYPRRASGALPSSTGTACSESRLTDHAPQFSPERLSAAGSLSSFRIGGMRNRNAC